MNKNRLSVMIVLMIMTFLYMIRVINISEYTNYSLSLAITIFSISSVFDTYMNKNKIEEKIQFFLNTLALTVAVVFPCINELSFINKLMDFFDANELVLISLFFTLASQWSAEIKIKDIKGKRKDEKI